MSSSYKSVRQQRTSKPPTRFQDQTQYLPSAWGGSAGSNNRHTQGRDVDAYDRVYRGWKGRGSGGRGSELSQGSSDKTVHGYVKDGFVVDD